jgi:uncharacterized membrane protein
MWVPGQPPTNKPAASPPILRPPVPRPPAVAVAATPESSDPGQFKFHLIAAAAYITFIPAIVVLLITRLRQNRFIRFHSFQSIFFTVATIAITIALRILYSILTLIPVAGYLLAWLALTVAVLALGILWLVLLVKALQGQFFRLPVIGNLAEKV